MAAASGPRTLEVPAASGRVAAIGATQSEGVFVAFVGGGIQYLQFGAKSRWIKAGLCSETVAGEIGLHLLSGGDDAKFFRVSFVDGARKTWICVRVPSPVNAGTDAAAEEVGRTELPSEVLAACSERGGTVAAVALRSGAIRFLDLSTGQLAGKGLKIEPAPSKSATALVSLAPLRVALIRGGPSEEGGLQFFVITFDEAAQKAVAHLQGTLSGDSLGTPEAFAGAAALGPVGGFREDRVLLCWQSGERKEAGGEAVGCSFASAVLSQESPKVAALPSAPGVAAWACAKGYLAQWGPRPGGGKQQEMQLTLRDARFGMSAASCALRLPVAPADAPLLTSTAGGVTLIVGQDSSGGAKAVGVQWQLPSFSLQRIVGKGVGQLAEAPEGLKPLQEVLAGKRPRSDAAVERLFDSGKRHTSTDLALAALVRKRAWPVSPALIDEIIFRRSWAAACAALSLPELDEDLSVKLLAAHQELLARVVRRARAPHLLEHALRDHLPTSQLPKVLEVLLQWLEAYGEFSEETLCKEVPGLPALQEIVTFLGALADGCMPMLVQLEASLLERTMEALNLVRKRSLRTSHLYASLREVYRIRKPLKPVTEAPVVEVVVFDEV